MDQFTIHVNNSFAAVHSANDTVARWLADRGAPAEIQYFANLAIEEFGTNAIKYGYDDTAEHSMEVSLSLSSSGLTLTLVDDGHPFNPLDAPEPKLSVPAEERTIGGLGIYLVRKTSDRMEYAREGNKNKLMLHKAFRSQTP